MSIVAETNYFGNITQLDEPKVLIIPSPYEYTTSHDSKGTKNGPQAILNASTKLESFDEELWQDISSIGINTSNFINCEFVNNRSSQPFNEIEQAVRNSVIAGSLPVVLGGEHSLSYGAIKAIYDLYPDVSILYFNAHSNLKDSFSNNKFNSACTCRRITEAMPDLKIVQVGIRSISKDEMIYLENNESNIEVYFAKDKNNCSVADILTNLSKNIYISFSFDVLDTAIMPSVTRPVPGGYSFEYTLDILKNTCAFKEIVGMDFTEFTPVSGLHAPDSLAAKLIYKTIGYSHARELGVFEGETVAESVV